jgi:hypothetical protein
VRSIHTTAPANLEYWQHLITGQIDRRELETGFRPSVDEARIPCTGKIPPTRSLPKPAFPRYMPMVGPSDDSAANPGIFILRILSVFESNGHHNEGAVARGQISLDSLCDSGKSRWWARGGAHPTERQELSTIENSKGTGHRAAEPHNRRSDTPHTTPSEASPTSRSWRECNHSSCKEGLQE